MPTSDVAPAGFTFQSCYKVPPEKGDALDSNAGRPPLGALDDELPYRIFSDDDKNRWPKPPKGLMTCSCPFHCIKPLFTTEGFGLRCSSCCEVDMSSKWCGCECLGCESKGRLTSQQGVNTVSVLSQS